MDVTRARLVVSGELQHVYFYCPACERQHSIRVGLWSWNGDLLTPTFEPSIKCTWEHGQGYEQRVCHSYVRSGRIQYLNDCTHALKGQTVDLPPMGAES